MSEETQTMELQLVAKLELAAYCADEIDKEFVEEMCSKEIKKLGEVLDEEKYNWLSLAHASNCGEFQFRDLLEDEYREVLTDVSEEGAQRIVRAFEKVRQKFYKETGLRLNIRTGDDSDYFWSVENAYVFSPAGEKLKDKIDRRCWACSE